jgi:hypothetical protein
MVTAAAPLRQEAILHVFVDWDRVLPAQDLAP